MGEEPARPVEKVGLLFVHGIGQQKRWEHLRSSVVEVAELLGAHCGDRASVSVVDRTGDWPHEAGEPDIHSPAPITVSLRQQTPGGCRIDFECHEVWWADQGKRRGLMESVSFWIWGLGQWGAPIYHELDASGLELEEGARRPVVRMPRSVAIEPGAQHRARINLAWAALGAALAAISISLFKRVVKFLAGATPSTTLIVDYVGDVQTYQERARLGRGPVSDPGHPWRVAIRRRMVSEMVAMGAREFDRWYIFAHSLGTVVAFNGITEIGHTLPNYLPRALWESLPAHLRRDGQCARRQDIENMMPSRPTWHDDKDCIDRPRLFERLDGFITYGSPLDKFAALWPRIVAAERYGGTIPEPSATRKQVFANTDWVNILSLTDPVAGNIDRYDTGEMGLNETDLPELTNIERPDPQFFGVSHIEYFQVKDRCEAGDYKDYYDKFFGWLTTGTVPLVEGEIADPDRRWGRFTAEGDRTGLLRLEALVAFVAVLAAATLIVGLAVLAVAPEGWKLLPEGYGKEPFWNNIGGYLGFFGKTALGTIALATLGVYLCGAWRWLREQLYNRRLARHDAALETTAEHDRIRLERFMLLASWQAGAASFFLFVLPILVFAGLWTVHEQWRGEAWLDEWGGELWLPLLLGWVASSLALSLAARVQGWITYWASRLLGSGGPPG